MISRSILTIVVGAHNVVKLSRNSYWSHALRSQCRMRWCRTRIACIGSQWWIPLRLILFFECRSMNPFGNIILDYCVSDEPTVGEIAELVAWQDRPWNESATVWVTRNFFDCLIALSFVLDFHNEDEKSESLYSFSAPIWRHKEDFLPYLSDVINSDTEHFISIISFRLFPHSPHCCSSSQHRTSSFLWSLHSNACLDNKKTICV